MKGILRTYLHDDVIEYVAVTPDDPYYRNRKDGSVWSIVSFVRHGETGRKLALAFEVPDCGAWLYRVVDGVRDQLPNGPARLFEYDDFVSTHEVLADGALLAG